MRQRVDPGDSAIGPDDLAIEQRTWDMYQREGEAFAAWCETNGRAYSPASARAVSDYLKSLVLDQGKAFATARRVRVALSVLHNIAFSRARAVNEETPPNPAADVLVTQTLKKLRNELAEKADKSGTLVEKPKRGVSYEELVRMVESEPVTLAGKRNRAIMTACWFGLLRRSEVVRIDRGRLEYKRRKGFTATIHRSKTNRTGEPEVLTFVERPDLPICPVRELREWLLASGIVEGPVFRRVFRGAHVGERVGKSRLSSGYVATIVQDAGERVGVATSDELGAHSLRHGSATALGEHQVDAFTLMRKGRWKSFTSAQKYVTRSGSLGSDPMRGILKERDSE